MSYYRTTIFSTHFLTNILCGTLWLAICHIHMNLALFFSTTHNLPHQSCGPCGKVVAQRFVVSKFSQRTYLFKTSTLWQVWFNFLKLSFFWKSSFLAIATHLAQCKKVEKLHYWTQKGQFVNFTKSIISRFGTTYVVFYPKDGNHTGT